MTSFTAKFFFNSEENSEVFQQGNLKIAISLCISKI